MSIIEEALKKLEAKKIATPPKTAEVGKNKSTLGKKEALAAIIIIGIGVIGVTLFVVNPAPRAKARGFTDGGVNLQKKPNPLLPTVNLITQTPSSMQVKTPQKAEPAAVPHTRTGAEVSSELQASQGSASIVEGKPAKEKTIGVPASPFAPSPEIVFSGEEEMPDFVLNGITRGMGEPVAVINGEILKEGEAFDNATLLKILEDRVILRYNEKEITLKLK